MALSACGGGKSNPLGGGGDCGSDTNKVTVGSANFPESETVADVYAEALRANGFSIDSKLNIGSREAYVPALKQCAISLIPDYTGNLLQYLDKSSTATSPDEVNAALTKALGDQLAIGTPAPGEDSDAVVVTKATADKWNLKSIADLATHSSEVKLAAPAEFAERPGGLPGLKKNYGLDIPAANFVPIADGSGPATVKALVDGQVTAADIFTTSPAITANNLVVLADPKHNFPPQNVVPLFNTAKKSDKLLKVLDAVSAKLTTAELISLNTAVSGSSKTEPATAAKQWVAAQGLDKPIA
ncbi:ABC transporter substrate-binding protein [Nocardia seriolae]|uniref:ABC transporter substrate-binding protein n=1 Tax=Nocardia seriolae TaxID=37332 RepID=UPI0009DF112C|nr:ABC transporter substrate-binding protein [Nocardia seriolae]MTJ65864.1 glycine/betaine ABC transporter substrate-binding protein [Nocardia seriolae]MTJ72344.1 glycine/betaine ABC transporter substrate-binding protein [Nocardia seriolae]MTJ86207.1 glycine/betaine ABC transporter substrate-binding protein [Nocardia seriolae]MTK30203.1 glycine/betaine ABC transporter substrate-binding protein [Nocardia seriolae]MTK43861.1 glycine/betaine ABC transporter substrate-binding protein [Nocardia ser